MISPACSSERALAEMSTTIDCARDSTTSNAVTTPPHVPTALTRSPAELAVAGASTRTVIE